jgi:hypothetical protein
MSADSTSRGERERIKDIAGLIRAGADGELTAEEQRALDEHLRANPGDGARVEFERELRAAVKRTMGASYRPPAGLRERIAAAVASDDAGEAAHVEIIADRTRERSFWAGAGIRRVLAAAAVIVLAFGAWYAVTQSAPQQSILRESDGRVIVASFLTREHRFCDADKDHAKRKLLCRDPNRLSENCNRWIGEPVSLASVFEEEGVDLIGMGPCSVPGQGRSVHLQMTVTDNGKPILVSIFIQEASAGRGVDDGAYDLREAEDGSLITVWRDAASGLVFYLVSDEQAGVERTRDLLEVPSSTRSL